MRVDKCIRLHLDEKKMFNQKRSRVLAVLMLEAGTLAGRIDTEREIKAKRWKN